MRTNGMLMTLVLVVAALAGCATPGGELAKAASGDLTLKEFAPADFRNAAAEGLAAREAGKLPAGDRWPECFNDIAVKLEAAAPPKPDGVVGLATLAMRGHILKSKTREPISPECSQVILQLQADGLKIGSLFVPGGRVLRSLLP